MKLSHDESNDPYENGSSICHHDLLLSSRSDHITQRIDPSSPTPTPTFVGFISIHHKSQINVLICTLRRWENRNEPNKMKVIS